MLHFAFLHSLLRINLSIQIASNLWTIVAVLQSQGTIALCVQSIKISLVV